MRQGRGKPVRRAGEPGLEIALPTGIGRDELRGMTGQRAQLVDHGVDGILIDGINLGSHAPHYIVWQPYHSIESEQGRAGGPIAPRIHDLHHSSHDGGPR